MKRRPLLMAAGLAATLSSARVRAQVPDLVLGQTGILSGPLGGPVKTMLAGAGLAIADANAQGGIGGRKLRLVSMDDELKPEKAIANYEQLLSKDNVLAFLGCVGSGTTAAAARILTESGAPMVGGFAVADSAREKIKGAGYFIRATSGREAEALVQHLTTIGVTRLAVAHLDNPGGVEVLKLINKALESHQLTALASTGVKGDFSNAGEAAKTLAAVNPQAVLMYLGGPVGGNVMKAMWALGSYPSFYGMSIVPGDLTFKLLGQKARGLAISQIVPYPWNQVDPQILAYRRLADAAKVPVGYYSLEGYVNALVMLDALKRAGADASRPRLHAALRATRYRVAQMTVDFTSDPLNGSRFVELVQVTHEGRFVR
jgi:branched-chain amino acid transport system substrate-binding protein